MSKKQSYLFRGTKGDIVRIARSLPQKGEDLLSQGWKDISHPKQAGTGHYTYMDPETGVKVRFDEAVSGKQGFEGKDHYHILNPNKKGRRDKYLDVDGNVCNSGSRESHILPKGRK
ncbi:MAG: hypothetical protein IKE69_08325 [Thermoguttaceae bacterium]|nr:hypothetical protein [Thermoguttaceae bacterium]